MTRTKKFFAIAMLLSVIAMLFGSWAPFHVQRASLEGSWQQLFQVTYQGHFSRSDWTANILLGFPFVLAFGGLFDIHRGSALRRIWLCVVGVMFSSVLSLVCEVGQCWFAGRVPSIWDWVAQVIGATLGCLLWQIGGRFVSDRITVALEAKRPFDRFESVIAIAASVALIWSILPGDILVSPVDLARKWSRGRIEVIPFTHIDGSIADNLYQWMAGMFVALPLGMWVGLRMVREVQKEYSGARVILAAMVAGALPELLQIPVGSRTASATDAVFGMLGALAGIQFTIWLRGDRDGLSRLRRTQWFGDPAFWFVLSIVFALLLSAISWMPFNFITDTEEIAERIKVFLASPFEDRGGSDLRTLFRFFRLALMSAPLGVVLGIGVTCMESRWIQKAAGLAAMGFLFLFCVFLEVGQLLETSRTGGGVGVILRFVAMVIGYLLARTMAGAPFMHSTYQVDEAEASNFLPTALHPHPFTNDPESNLAAATREYVPGFHGLRALSCLAVFGVHWQQITKFDGAVGPLNLRQLLENGNTGVAFFMVLTGFLLATRLWSQNEVDRPQNALHGYWRHRAVRILPTYWASLAVVCVIGGYWRSPRGWIDTLLHSLFLHNLLPNTLYSMSSPFWAIAVIFQFYVAFFLVLILLRKAGWLSDVAIGLVIAILGIACQVASTYLSMQTPGAGWQQAWLGADSVCLQHSLLSHMPVFCLGVLAAALHQKRFNISTWLSDVLIVTGCLGLLLILSTPLDQRLEIPGGRYNFPVVPLLVTGIVLLTPRSKRVVWALEQAPLRRLGIISYGVYLFHLPVLKLIEKVARHFGWQISQHMGLYALVGLAITLFIAELSYRCLERPLAKSLRRYDLGTESKSYSTGGKL